MTPLLKVTITRGRKFVYRCVFLVLYSQISAVCGVIILLHNPAFLPLRKNMAGTLPLLPISNY